MSFCCNVDETPQELNSCLSVACGKIGFAVCHFAQVAEPTDKGLAEPVSYNLWGGEDELRCEHTL